MKKTNEAQTPREKALKGNKTLGLIFTLVGIAFLIAGIIIALVSKGDSGIVVLIFLILAASGLLAGGYELTIERTRIKRVYCKYCGTKYNYDHDVAWTVDHIDYKTSESNGDITAKKVATMSFNCTCSNCGKNTQFTKKFTLASVDKNGNLQKSNQSIEAQKYFQ